VVSSGVTHGWAGVGEVVVAMVVGCEGSASSAGCGQRVVMVVSGCGLRWWAAALRAVVTELSKTSYLYIKFPYRPCQAPGRL